MIKGISRREISVLLESINSPRQLHSLTLTELNELACEIREKIIATVVSTGGHLGANLGVVEITLALHSLLTSPTDKIIWDVGHQCYPHKLITGRYARFNSLRQFGGISGFPDPAESSHDAFRVGHSSTSISAAIGMAMARDLQQQDFIVAAVIGDGALTAGEAFEALNHAGQLDTNLIVVLNDNAMSIAKNVGAMSNYLNKLRLDPTLSRARNELEGFIKRIPAIGSSMSRLGLTVKDAIKSLLPGQLFEELGFSYFGPFDGHNIKQLQWAIKDAIHRGGPVLIHTLTQKGRGYVPAEKNPSKYHGLGPKTINHNQNELVDYSTVFGNSLVKIAENDQKITAITAAMQDGTGLSRFAQVYPSRFFDVGIAEQHALTFAAGLATQGLKPVVAIYSTFLQRGYDQLLHDICLQNLPVVVIVDHSGVVGHDGPTHHGVFDISYLRLLPNLKLLAPKNGAELDAMLKWALAQDGPVAIRYSKAKTTLDDQICFRFDKQIGSEIIGQGKDCAILAVGNMVKTAEKAAKLLQPNIKCTVVNMRTLKPLDVDTIGKVVSNVKIVCTVEDNVIAGGFGSSILEQMREQCKTVINLGYPDEFIPQASIEELHRLYRLNPQGIAEKIANYATLKM